ncbi:MAG: glutamate N-acetyltransferase / amino-acid N-acetyltransferase [Actinomycetota bacterium]|nr:glutamate N-acetyltransferase / amino-acid N-acetyltransferase [Actinomycetota bacterium]
MSVTAAQGFRAAGVTAGLKESGDPDVALVVNDGPTFVAAGVFTRNTVVAAPVRWSRQVLRWQALKAVVLNSGGANACTGPEGFADAHHTAEQVAADLGLAPIDVAVCSTGLIGVPLNMPLLLAGVDAAAQALSAQGGADAARAILTTDTVVKQAVAQRAGATVGGMAKGAGMIAPGMATMLCVLTTDAIVDPEVGQLALERAVEQTFNRIDSDGCMSTNDTVILMASGAGGAVLDDIVLEDLLTEVCSTLARAMIADAEGASKEILIEVDSAASETEAVAAARAVARSNLFKCAMYGEDPNWGRIVSAVGASEAAFDPDDISVTINGVQVCAAGAPVPGAADRADLSAREITIVVDLAAGPFRGHVWTNDLTPDYIAVNSEYST